MVLDTKTYYFEDDGQGIIYSFYLDSNNKVVANPNFGTVDYEKGEVFIGYATPVTIVNTTVGNSIVEIVPSP